MSYLVKTPQVEIHIVLFGLFMATFIFHWQDTKGKQSNLNITWKYKAGEKLYILRIERLKLACVNQPFTAVCDKIAMTGAFLGDYFQWQINTPLIF